MSFSNFPIETARWTELSSQLQQSVVDMDLNQFPYPWELSEWVDLSNTPRPHILSLLSKKDSSELAGFTLLEEIDTVEDKQKGRSLHLLKIIIGQELRQKGLGGHFLTGQIDDFSASYDNIYLEVAESNLAAQALYRRVGFQETHRTGHYYSDGEAAVFFRKSLN